MRHTKHAPIRRERRGARWWYANILDSILTRVVVGLCLSISAIGYIVVTSNVATKGYEMKEVERTVASVRDDVQRLQLSIAQYRSFSYVQSRMTQLQMEPIGTITFVDTHGDSVAAR